jgi:hypothetical protein
MGMTSESCLCPTGIIMNVIFLLFLNQRTIYFIIIMFIIIRKVELFL